MQPDAERPGIGDSPAARNTIADTATGPEYHPVRCDSCHGILGPDDGLRFRHADCPAPALPLVAWEAISDAYRIGGRR